MSARQQARHTGKTLPIALIGQAIRKLLRHELEAVPECLIERLDEIDGDTDLEASHDQEARDEREPDNQGCTGSWDIDQRLAIMDS